MNLFHLFFSKERKRLLLDEVKTVCLFVTSDQSSALSSGWPASSTGEENLPSARLPAAVTPLCLKVQPFVGVWSDMPACLVPVTDFCRRLSEG